MPPPCFSATSTPHLFQRFAVIATKEPDRFAIVEANKRSTYGDLLGRIDAISAKLMQAGTKPGEYVAVILPNGSDFIAAAFATWRCGAVLVPLHVRFQENEILKYVIDCHARTIITNSRLEVLARSVQARHSDVEHVWIFSGASGDCQNIGSKILPSCGALNAYTSPEIAPDWPALSQYSTGSTGFSKRITRTHRQLLGEFDTMAEILKLTGDDRILGVAPFFHSYGLSNVVLGSQLSGATLYAVNDFFPKDIAKLIEAERLTGFPGVPFMYQLLADLEAKSNLSSLRYALSAGAPLPAATAHSFRAKYHMGIRQLYGSTETGVITLEPLATGIGQEPTVGLPIPGVFVRIMDESCREMPEGGEGQVAVTSRYAATSYDNQVSQSESYFAEGMFFPGDLGRINADGKLALHGRKRRFINVAGNKVDPTEVETVLRKFQAISEAVVFGVSDGVASEKVKAILVTTSNCTRAEIMEHCKCLAEFKRPRVIEFRKEIPKSPLGKILRKYLLEEYDGTKPKCVFDPRTGFAQHPETRSSVRPAFDLASVPPFLRVLLVTDGTVTKNLEAYFWEPIEVELLLHAQMASELPYPEIFIKVQDPIVKRRIVLRGRITGSAYAVAETIIAIESFPKELERSLIEGCKGIGEVLREHKLETYREILSVEPRLAGEWAGYLDVDPAASVLVRDYKIYHDRRPAVQILEVFPEARFKS